MHSFIDAISESLKQSLSIRLWIYFLILYFIHMIIDLVIIAIFLGVALIAFFGSLANLGIESFQHMLSTPSGIFSLLTVAFIALTALLVVLLYIAAVFEGIRFNLFNNYIKTRKLEFGKAFEDTMPRAKTYFGISLVLSIAIALLFVVLLLPAIVPIVLNPLIFMSPAQLAGPLFCLMLAILIGMLVLLFAYPFIAMLPPIAFFEKNSVMGTIRRAKALVKPSYWGNFAGIIVYFVIVVGVTSLVNWIAQFLGMAFMLPMLIASAAGSEATIGLGFQTSLAIFYLIIIVLLIPVTIWASIFQTACFRNLYFHNLNLQGAKQRQMAPAPRRQQSVKTKKKPKKPPKF